MKLEATDEQVVRMGQLAVMASVPVGMGILHYDASLKPTDIRLEVRGGDNPGLFIDYFQGRMVKFRCWKRDGGFEFPDTISHEYESWIATYPSYDALFTAAKASLAQPEAKSVQESA
jgi:hypothetical protein